MAASSTHISNINRQPISYLPNIQPKEVMSTISYLFSFAMQYLKSPTAVGTPFPCSKHVGDEIVKNISDESNNLSSSRRILEVGPGLGAFTGHIISKMGPHDHLDLVEIEEEFCTQLREQYGFDRRVHIHHLSITDWRPEETYDHIVTAVPLNALVIPKVVRQILDSFCNLLKMNGTLSSLEYVGTSTLKGLFTCDERARRKYDKVQNYKLEFFYKFNAEHVIVLKNLPPARVSHIIRRLPS